MTEIKKKYSTFEQSKINFQLRYNQKYIKSKWRRKNQKNENPKYY